MSRSELSTLIDAARLNPMAVQRAGIEYLEKVRGGEVEVVDASNAFVYLMEFSSTLFSNLARKDELLNLRQYPELAQTREDLYHHMSDVDYLNIFSIPSTTELLLVYSLDEVMEKAVDTGVNGIRKLVIPRHTQVTAGDIPFTLQYPIEIRVLPHQGIQVVYDNRLPSPLQALENNKVNFSILNYNVGHQEYIQLEVPAQQIEIKSYTTPLSAAKVFNKSYKYKDQFHHCRVYTTDAAGKWQEIKTTHSALVYDPNTPTAVLKLLSDGLLNVSIPQVYYSTGRLNRTLRIDIYTTRGALELAIQGYSADMFMATYEDYDNDDNGKYTNPTRRLTSSLFMAGLPATGGSNAIGFDKLKERVIHNALGAIDLPITNVQIQTQLDRLTDAGFSCVTDIDNATNRLYAATREMPTPDIKEISSGIGSNVVTLSQSINQILSRAEVMDNGQRVTLLPTTLYRDEGGYLSIVDRAERDALLALSPDLLTEEVNGGTYFYTPFHYVYDLTDGVFKVRPYFFGEPTITRKFFVEDNGTMGMGVSVNTHHLTRTETGWVLQIMTASTDGLKALEDEDTLVAQLAYTPPGEVTRVFLNGTLLGRDPDSKEWIFEFRFDSTWDVDRGHNVYLDGFEGEGVSPHPYPAGLSTVFDVFYAVRNDLVEPGERSGIDDRMGKFLIADAVTGLYHEQITVTLGHELDGMWARARSTVGEEQYLRHEEDVPLVHTTNIPARDPETGAVVIEYIDGKPTLVYEHRAGDPVMEAGQAVYLHRRGDVIIQNDSPIVAAPRNILRQVELVLFDGAYYFVTNNTDLAYKETVPKQVVEWVNITLKPIRDRLLENTTLWFHPKTTVGQVEAIVDGSLAVSLAAEQSLRVEYFVTPQVYRDETLKEEIRKTTRKTIALLFKEMQVTRNGISEALKDTMAGDIIGVKVNNLGGERDFSVITMAHESARLCIGKRLVALPNATYGVEDAIDIVFSQHAL